VNEALPLCPACTAPTTERGGAPSRRQPRPFANVFTGDRNIRPDLGVSGDVARSWTPVSGACFLRSGDCGREEAPSVLDLDMGQARADSGIVHAEMGPTIAWEAG